MVNARAIANELTLGVGNVHRYVKPLDARTLAQSLDVSLAALDAFAARAGRRTSAR